MSLLKKYASANPLPAREVEYVTLLSYTGTRPVLVDGDSKERIRAIVQLEGGEQMSLFFFRDSVYGLPAFVPKGGLPAQVTVGEYTDSENVVHVNGISMGVGA